MLNAACHILARFKHRQSLVQGQCVFGGFCLFLFWVLCCFCAGKDFLSSLSVSAELEENYLTQITVCFLDEVICALLFSKNVVRNKVWKLFLFPGGARKMVYSKYTAYYFFTKASSFLASSGRWRLFLHFCSPIQISFSKSIFILHTYPVKTTNSYLKLWNWKNRRYISTR